MRVGFHRKAARAAGLGFELLPAPEDDGTRVDLMIYAGGSRGVTGKAPSGA